MGVHTKVGYIKMKKCHQSLWKVGKLNNDNSKRVSEIMGLRTLSNGNISSLLVPCWGNPPFTGGFPSQRPVTRSFDVFFDLHMNKRLSKQSRLQWLETPTRSLWRHCNDHVDLLLIASKGYQLCIRLARTRCCCSPLRYLGMVKMGASND